MLVVLPLVWRLLRRQQGKEFRPTPRAISRLRRLTQH
jgi:hypothetical protein